MIISLITFSSAVLFFTLVRCTDIYGKLLLEICKVWRSGIAL
jgi:hypothetical protein